MIFTYIYLYTNLVAWLVFLEFYVSQLFDSILLIRDNVLNLWND
jgi:hypothetical protein